MIKSIFRNVLILTLLFTITLIGQYNIYETIDLEKVEYSPKDFGTMWTFDDVPLDYLKNEYGFEPTEQWLEEVQKSALLFGGGCSAAFVSEDGLIMTNHHCGRGQLGSVQKEGENLLRDGFYASTLDEERRIPNLFVEQLILIDDVTAQVISAINEGNTDAEKVENKKSIINELEKQYSEDTGLRCEVVTLYNGGKYSIYGYKRYEELRLVMSPDFQIAATGWDWDNFTYPRYELDFAFYRAYDENGKPVNSPYHFTWSKKGADEGEPIFVVGRPGNTDRLLSVAQLEFFRDYTYPTMVRLFNEVYEVYYDLFHSRPENESQLLNSVMGLGNARKSYAGRLLGLRDEYIMAKKRDFQKKLIERVKADSELNQKYGHIWDAIENVVEEQKKYANELFAFQPLRFAQPAYIKIAGDVITAAEQLSKAENERLPDYKNDKINETIENIFPSEFDKEKEDMMLRAYVNFLVSTLGEEHEFIKNLSNGKSGDEAVEVILAKTKLSSEENIISMFNEREPGEILNSDDPFIMGIQYAQKRFMELQSKSTELNNTLQVLNQELGEVVFYAFGDVIPPDATSTLRISDGVIAGYEYNGTIAPGKTTYYGLYDRFYSFDGDTYPWGLHERWLPPAPELDLRTPIGFASTNDIVGGNSGSSVINQNKEIVGLVHDGNLESLAGHFIFIEENNRTVATDSWGLMEALKYVFKTDPLVKELESSKLPE
ncbi:MAG: S46 family peptidase [Melioribacteraceae bacterium]|nr:S46 family peptidase [Melioribacteraceae bacterium]MCF8354219.1 S46 family peptidase [Melioribacteraceae bacterium]MCF8392865.1 S46 family peptidase [Melioribacteraceae bacterium]MCF8418649.1 S46 family peptidase [Melioribacteraceae bacterium]